MRVVKFLGSLRLSVFLLVFLFCAVLIGTLIQGVSARSDGAAIVFHQAIPGLLAVLGLNLLVGAILHLERRWSAVGLWGLHLTLVALCWGSLFTETGRTELVVGIVPGQSTEVAFPMSNQRKDSVPLGFRLLVRSFEIVRYDASQKPADYLSRVTIDLHGRQIDHTIQMNHPLRVGPWTIYPSSVASVQGDLAPVFKITKSSWGIFPYAIACLLAVFTMVHVALHSRDRHA